VLKQIEGSRAVAETVARCRPQVICAYPITPQTHIVEALGALVKKGELNAGFLNVESEFAAMSAVIGASAAGARTYTATASQGLMTVANRAIGAPINIWNDHSDSMSQRDAGWIQLYAETNQEAADLHIQAFRIAEELSNPVMVCMDGFVLTHASERADIPGQDEVDAFLPPYLPRQVLDPDDPVSIGAMVGPEAFTEVRFLAEERMRQALELIPDVATAFEHRFGRESGGLVKPYRTADAELIIVALGSVLGTVKDTIDELREDGLRAGALGITSFRPFPVQSVRAVLAGGCRPCRVVVLERALAPGSGGIVTADVRAALAATDGSPPRTGDAIISTVVAGLGGRPVSRKSLRTMLLDANRGELPPFSFLDLQSGLIEAELARTRATRRSGPTAENMLRDLGVAASGTAD